MTIDMTDVKVRVDPLDYGVVIKRTAFYANRTTRHSVIWPGALVGMLPYRPDDPSNPLRLCWLIANPRWSTMVDVREVDPARFVRLLTPIEVLANLDKLGGPRP